MNNQMVRTFAAIAALIMVALVGFFAVRAVTSSVTSVKSSNVEDRSGIYRAETLPQGVNQYSVDSLGPYVARSAYLIDMTSDRSPNDALLRNSGKVMNSGLLDRLKTESRSTMFVSGLPLESLKSEGVTSWSTSTAVLDSSASEQSDNTAHRRYTVETRPIYDSGKTGAAYKMTVDIDFSRHGAFWFVDDYTSR